jgi:hypothetical protein
LSSGRGGASAKDEGCRETILAFSLYPFAFLHTERARDAELADLQKIIVRRMFAINHLQPFRFLKG